MDHFKICLLLLFTLVTINDLIASSVHNIGGHPKTMDTSIGTAKGLGILLKDENGTFHGNDGEKMALGKQTRIHSKRKLPRLLKKPHWIKRTMQSLAMPFKQFMPGSRSSTKQKIYGVISKMAKCLPGTDMCFGSRVVEVQENTDEQTRKKEGLNKQNTEEHLRKREHNFRTAVNSTKFIQKLKEKTNNMKKEQQAIAEQKALEEQKVLKEQKALEEQKVLEQKKREQEEEEDRQQRDKMSQQIFDFVKDRAEEDFYQEELAKQLEQLVHRQTEAEAEEKRQNLIQLCSLNTLNELGREEEVLKVEKDQPFDLNFGEESDGNETDNEQKMTQQEEGTFERTLEGTMENEKREEKANDEEDAEEKQEEIEKIAEDPGMVREKETDNQQQQHVGKIAEKQVSVKEKANQQQQQQQLVREKETANQQQQQQVGKIAEELVRVKETTNQQQQQLVREKETANQQQQQQQQKQQQQPQSPPPLRPSQQPQQQQPQSPPPLLRPLLHKNGIRLALRKYLCDLHFTKMEKWEMHKNVAAIIYDGKPKEVENHQMVFKNFLHQSDDDNEPSHNFVHDFKFTVFFPNEFASLWPKFGMDTEQLLLAMTAKRLQGFENPAKSDSKFFSTWAGDLFIKTVLMKPKTISLIEPYVEKDFFFKHVSSNRVSKFYDWTLKDREDSGNFKGGFWDYYKYLEDNAQATLLPKFFMLFSFEPLDDKGEPVIYTVQNGLFPNGVPRVHYKFDLKGSSKNRLLEIKEEAKHKEPIWMDRNLISHPTDKPEPEGFFPNGITVDGHDYERVKEMLERDSQRLQTLNIIDYSLLLGVHFVDPNNKEIFKTGLPATCTKCREFAPKTDEMKAVEGEDKERRKLHIFIGVIDILQAFVLRRQIETRFNLSNTNLVFPKDHPRPKPWQHQTIINPVDYKNRFVDFITSVVFKSDDEL